MSFRALIVDDDEQIREQLDRALTALDFEVSSAADGREAWSSIRATPQHFDLIITDVRMPNMNGKELLQRLHQHHPEIPVAIITGHGDLDTTIDALRGGAFDFLTKPFGLTDLQRMAQRFRALREDAQYLGMMVEACSGSFREHLEISIPSKRTFAQQIGKRLMNYLLPLLRAKRISTNNFRLCLTESLENAIVHGNLSIESGMRDRDWGAFEATIAQRENDPRYAQRQVRILVDIASSRLSLKIQDEGAGFTVKQPAGPAEAMATSGRGLFLIRSFMDEVAWEDGGRTICLTKHLG